MSDPGAEARRQWSSARSAALAVLREPGDLPARERELLRVSVLPQIDAALATLDANMSPGELVRWNAFVPGTIECLADAGTLDPGLESARDHLRSGLEALQA